MNAMYHKETGGAVSPAHCRPPIINHYIDTGVKVGDKE